MEGYIVMVTEDGKIKRLAVSEIPTKKRGQRPVNCMEVEKHDAIVCTVHTDGTMDLVVITGFGQAIRFDEEELRPLGRGAKGIQAVELDEGDWVNALVAVEKG